MTFPCNTKLFPLQPEIKYMSMETIYLGIVIFLFVLAIFDLVVGVSNDAVNFLQSAVGAKAASFKTILFIAGIGVFIGAALSNGMMDIARHGIYQPEHFYFAEIMCILLAVMLTDVVLLDVFNTMGMPTSTTVSMVFELLGGTFALALIKVYNSDTLGLGDLINTDKALSVIMAIFVSVAIAFFFGMLVQWLARIVFTFNYKKNMKYSIALFGGIAATSIIYFMLIKGLKDSSFMTPENKQWIHANLVEIITSTYTQRIDIEVRPSGIPSSPSMHQQGDVVEQESTSLGFKAKTCLVGSRVMRKFQTGDGRVQNPLTFFKLCLSCHCDNKQANE